jgi:arylsulfatase A-like enzyme
MLGDHNLWRKTYAYQGSARVPFIVVPPVGQRQSVRSVADEVVELRDVMPTLLEAVGLQVPQTVDGRSVVSLCFSPAVTWRKYIHGEHCTCYSQEQEMQYVTDGRYKFVWLPRLGREQFFDLEQDPGECEDLVDDPDRQTQVAQWRDYLVQALAERDCGWVREGQLFCPPDEPLVSPYKGSRWLGKSQPAS